MTDELIKITPESTFEEINDIKVGDNITDEKKTGEVVDIKKGNVKGVCMVYKFMLEGGDHIVAIC